MNGWQAEKQPYQWQKLSQPLTEAQKQAEQAAMTPVEYGPVFFGYDCGAGYDTTVAIRFNHITGQTEIVQYDALAGQFTASE